MSEPSNAQLVEELRTIARRFDNGETVFGAFYATEKVCRLAAQRLEASPSTAAIIERMARAIFNAHQHLGAESTTWDSVEEQTRVRFRAIARHEWETSKCP